LQSSFTTGKPSFAERRRPARLGALAWVALVLCGALGCSRREDAPSHASPPAREPAAAPPTAAPDSANTEPATGAPAPSGNAIDAASGPRAADVSDGPPAPEGAPLAPLETVSAERLLGEVRRLGGKGTLVNAWASWCGPCKHELPMFAKLAKKHAGAGLNVVLVSLDEPADRDKAAAFLKERKLELTSYLAERPLGPFKQGMNPRWPGMLPASFLYDASGALRYFWGGEAFEEEIAPVLDAFAAGKPIAGEATPAIGTEGEAR